MTRILVTGGLGYIGSHLVLSLLQRKYQVVVVDNLSNSTIETVTTLRELSGQPDHYLKFHQVDIRDTIQVQEVFETYQLKYGSEIHPFNAVIHLAGLKSVPESLEQPDLYYQVNVVASQNLISLTQQYRVPKFIFSGSATVYGGDIGTQGYQECQAQSPEQATHMYGKSKRLVELAMESASTPESPTRFVSLRYFNPVGNHPSGKLGEDITLDRASNLLAMVAKVYCHNQTHPTPRTLSIFGNDYPDTPDGTCQRDFIHVLDLVNGHLSGLSYHSPSHVLEIFNLGCGIAVSVKEIIDEFSKATEYQIPTQIVERRPGDLAVSFASASRANSLLNWQTQFDITDACRDLVTRCNHFITLATITTGDTTTTGDTITTGTHITDDQK